MIRKQCIFVIFLLFPILFLHQTGWAQAFDDTAVLFIIQKTNGDYPLLDGISTRARKLKYPTVRMNLKIDPDDVPGSALSNIGTGFFVSESGCFLTNSHVVEQAEQLFLKTRSGKLIEASVLVDDKDNDLAILAPIHETHLNHWLPLGEFTPKNVGEKITVIGYPFPQILTRPTRSFGIVVDDKGLFGNTNGLQVSAPIQIGNSGSPILNRANEVIGIVNEMVLGTSILRDTGSLPPDLTFGLKVDAVKSLLARCGGTGAIRRHEEPVSVADAEQATALVFVNTSDVATDLSLPQKGIAVLVAASVINGFDIVHFMILRLGQDDAGRALSEVKATGCIAGKSNTASLQMVNMILSEIQRKL